MSRGNMNLGGTTDQSDHGADGADGAERSLNTHEHCTLILTLWKHCAQDHRFVNLLETQECPVVPAPAPLCMHTSLSTNSIQIYSRHLQRTGRQDK